MNGQESATNEGISLFLESVLDEMIEEDERRLETINNENWIEPDSSPIMI